MSTMGIVGLFDKCSSLIIHLKTGLSPTIDNYLHLLSDYLQHLYDYLAFGGQNKSIIEMVHAIRAVAGQRARLLLTFVKHKAKPDL